MKTVTHDYVNRMIGKANSKSHEVIIYFDGEERRYEPGNARTLPKNAEPGTYVIKIFVPPRKEGEEGTVDEYVITIDPPEEPTQAAQQPEPPTPPARMFEPSGNESVSMLMQMRQMDLESWERERRSMREEINQLREYFNKMLEVEREKYATALKTERDAYEFRLTLLQGNQAKLDEERAAIRETEQKIIKSELTRKMKGSDDDGMSLKDLMTIVAPFLMRSQPAAPQAPTGSTPSDWNKG